MNGIAWMAGATLRALDPLHNRDHSCAQPGAGDKGLSALTLQPIRNAPPAGSSLGVGTEAPVAVDLHMIPEAARSAMQVDAGALAAAVDASCG